MGNHGGERFTTYYYFNCSTTNLKSGTTNLPPMVYGSLVVPGIYQNGYDATVIAINQIFNNFYRGILSANSRQSMERRIYV